MEILYEDRDIAVLVKPVGLDAQAAVPAALEAQLGGAFYPVHRLDLNVGGVMVYARTKQAAASLSRAIQDGSMVKEYVAMVHGTPPETGDWEDLLFKDSGKNKVFVVGRMRGGVKRRGLNTGCCARARLRWCAFGCIRAEATRFAYSLPAAAIRW